jgi:hypothetical protein
LATVSKINRILDVFYKRRVSSNTKLIFDLAWVLLGFYGIIRHRFFMSKLLNGKQFKKYSNYRPR